MALPGGTSDPLRFFTLNDGSQGSGAPSTAHTDKTSCPPPDASVPFTTAPVPLSSLTTPDGANVPYPVLSTLIRQAFAAQRASSAWARGKVHKTQVGDVQVFKGGSGQKGKFAKCAWHGRWSLHKPSQTFDLGYDEFREGLLLKHANQEAQYIHECVHAKLVKSLREGTAEVWQNSYHLPSISSNRDFCELILTLDLPSHAEPYSESHELATLSAYAPESATLSTVAKLARGDDEGEGGNNNKRRSFFVIQLPVTTDECPERTKEGYVRASYASVEGVQERDDGSIEWNMFVQSNVGGRIPHMFQEMAMPNKIHPDVPSFILWAKDNLESRKQGVKVAGGSVEAQT